MLPITPRPWSRAELNCRLRPYQRRTLPTELRDNAILRGVVGVEPTRPPNEGVMLPLHHTHPLFWLIVRRILFV